MNAMTAEERTAPSGDTRTDGPVTLMNRFAVRPERDDAFHALWTDTSKYFRAQPGFVSLRLHRAISTGAEYRWVNVATWESDAAFRAAHNSEEFRRVVTQPGWDEFPSSPMLYEVVTAVG
ncbi:MAG TPA: antibiotic biosynthesis monooxygenase family protein [Mycobacteriales bacterium]|jgi:heme-degrading monooxygenase HmoA|nr:antibiotic biosynthesis monooxygenase family protein [Mycobacteriales bacterium]